MLPADDVWLCLHFSQLSLAVFADRDPQRPAAVVEQRALFCANRANLEVGLAVSTASSLYPDLLVLERQPKHESELLQSLACLAYGFTPAVALAADNSLLLEIGSCRRLYRGINNLLGQLQDGLRERGHTALFGIADTPQAAWLLARYSHPPALSADELDRMRLRAQLAAIPVELLPIDSDVVKMLQQIGIATLGDIQALPTAALGKRFGAEFLRYLQKLQGACADPQKFFIPSPVFRQGLNFLDGILQRQMLLFPMKRLLHGLCDYLRARQLHCHVLHWQIYDAHQPQAEIIVELSRTQNDWQTFLELTRIKLDQVILREPVFSVSLCSDDFFESTPVSAQLFPDAQDHAAAGHALFDRLQARLGKAALLRIETRDSLWPERSWSVVDASQAVRKKTPVEITPLLNTGPRPLWLLPQPKSLRERDGQPVWKTELTLLRGPERVDNHWWQVKNGSQDDNKNYQYRDYFVARTFDGRLCWIFREASFPMTDLSIAEEEAVAEKPTTEQIETAEPKMGDGQSTWFLHGWFA